MGEKDAYRFLTQTLDQNYLKKYMINLRNQSQNSLNQAERESGEEDHDRDDLTRALDFYLDNLDAIYYQPEYKYQPGHENYNEADKKEHKERVARMKECEEIISKQAVKYPTEYIMQLKVEEFHKKMTEFLTGLLIQLKFINEYHIDFRNWHAKFGMANLKKSLDTKVNANARGEFSLIRKSLGMGSKGIGKGGEDGDQGLKTIYTM